MFYLCLYHPVGDVSLRGVEVDADLCDWLAAEGEPLAVVLQVDLLHSSLRGLVGLQFEEVEVGLGEEHDIYSAVCGVYFYFASRFKIIILCYNISLNKEKVVTLHP